MNKLDWSPGNYGKGVIYPNTGAVRTWNTNGHYGEPHHAEMVTGDMSDTPSIHRDYSAFEILPDGEIEFGMLAQPGVEETNLIVQADPRLHLPKDEWDFEAAATPEGFNEWPDLSHLPDFVNTEKVVYSSPSHEMTHDNYAWPVIFNPEANKLYIGEKGGYHWDMTNNHPELRSMIGEYEIGAGAPVDALPREWVYGRVIDHDVEDKTGLYGDSVDTEGHTGQEWDVDRWGAVAPDWLTPDSGFRFGATLGEPESIGPDWNRGGPTEKLRPWNPEHKGKGFYHVPTGKVVTWDTENWAADPHHYAVARSMGYEPQKDCKTFTVYPGGGVSWHDPVTIDIEHAVEEELVRQGAQRFKFGSADAAFATELKLWLTDVDHYLQQATGPTPHHNDEAQIIQMPRQAKPNKKWPWTQKDQYEQQKRDWYESDDGEGSPLEYPYDPETWRKEHHAPIVELAHEVRSKRR